MKGKLWLVWADFFPPTINHMLFFVISLKTRGGLLFFTEAGFYYRTPKHFLLGFVADDILWPSLFSLPPKCRMLLVLWSNGSLPTDLWAGSDEETAWQALGRQRHSQRNPISARTALASSLKTIDKRYWIFREHSAAPSASACFPPALWEEGLSRHQEHAWVLTLAVPVWFCRDLTPPSAALSGIWPCARLDTSTELGKKS